MQILRQFICAVCVLCASAVFAQVPPALKPYVNEDSRVLVLNHVRVIDGTGATPAEDQRIDIEAGKIVRVQSAKLRNAFPHGAKIVDLTGKTVIPGLVGMHEHLFYPTPGRKGDRLRLYGEMADSAPRLYLAGGVTTARTTGTLEPYTDLSVKKLIDAGQTPGPKLRILKITGHLCAVGFREAAALGIDNLEHGIAVDTEFYPGKKPGVCPAQEAEEDFAKNVDIDSASVQEMIRDLVAHHVAVTSTLAVFEISVPNRPAMAKQAGAQAALSPEGWSTYLRIRSAIAEKNDPLDAAELKKEMQFERAFVKAGGLLLAGCDPTAFGGVLPGYGDQRGLELLVEAGFTPVEAIHIATQNGAVFLGEDATIGSIAAGKDADLVVIAGNPATKIDDVENVETVFKDGLGYDPAKLTQSVQGLVGLR